MEVECESSVRELRIEKQVLEERLKMLEAELRNTLKQKIILLQQLLKKSRKRLQELEKDEADLSGNLLSPVT